MMQQQDKDGRWQPATPLPWMIGYHLCRCDCGRFFWNHARYQKHFTAVHRPMLVAGRDSA